MISDNGRSVAGCDGDTRFATECQRIVAVDRTARQQRGRAILRAANTLQNNGLANRASKQPLAPEVACTGTLLGHAKLNQELWKRAKFVGGSETQIQNATAFNLMFFL